MSLDAGERLERILRALPTIVDKGEVTHEDIEITAGVDARTLLDDLRAFTERDDEPGGFVGAIQIFFAPNRVAVNSPHFKRPTRITLPELCALELGLAMIASTASPSERPAISRARARLRKAIVSLPDQAAREDLWYASGPALANEALLDTLRSAASEFKKVRMVYRRGDSSESSERIVHPYAVLPVRGKWFLIAFCERNEAVRFFRADRIQSAIRLDDPFTRPKEFDLKTLIDDKQPFVSPSAERLVVRYSARIARWIAEREEGERQPDGSFVVSHPLADDAWAVRHVLQYGPEAEVLEPSRVRDRLIETLIGMSSSCGD